MEFEWDPSKNAINEKKHGISFVDAVAIFEDPGLLVVESTRIEHGERRFRAI